jgi:hypothetical protein
MMPNLGIIINKLTVNIIYYQYDKLHRLDGGLMEFPSHDRSNCDIVKNNQIDADGNEYWYDDTGRFHRDNAPAIIIIGNCKQWFSHDLVHRSDGPAIEYDNGDYSYYQYNQFHRLDGPAIKRGNSYYWIIKGEKIDCKDNEEFLRTVKMRSLL